MTRIAWPALMRLGLAELRLAPEVFWDLTPAELLVIAGGTAPRGALDRAGFEALAARFPDGRSTRKQGSGEE